MDLKKLLKPAKIAVVGASEKENLGGFTARMMLAHAGERIDDVYFVNPGRERVFDRPCYPSLSALPERIDLAVIATAKPTVETLVEEAAQKGAGGVVVYASGYGETGKPEDIQAEESLKTLCRRLDIALMGPNCAGFINMADHVPAMGFLTTVHQNAGRVGLVSQSGMICTLLSDSGKTDFSYIISCGNSKVVEVVDYIDFLVDDEDTGVIAAYIEGVSNPTKFLATLKKAAKQQKPIILLKIGRSEAGSRSAASHTGSLSGSDAAFDAVFQKYGVIRVDDLEDLVGMSNLLSTLPILPKGDRVVSLNGSGGENGVSCDVGHLYGIHFPPFSTGTAERLKSILPDYASTNNPLDTTATICYDTEVFADAAEIIINDPNFDLALVGLTIVSEMTDLCVKHMSEGLVKLISEKRIDKPVIVVPAVESGRMPEYVNLLKNAGIPVTAPCFYAYKHVKKLLDYCKWRAALPDITLEDAVLSHPDSNRRTALSEHKSKEMLRSFGVRIPREAIVHDAGEAVEAASGIGFPLVLKIESDDILHKSDMGGVILNIQSKAAAEEAFRRILENAAKNRPDARINGVLVQEMVPSGLETIIGVNRDKLFGPMVLFGLGGVNTELLRDVALYPAPFGKAEALRMIGSLKLAKLFSGYRGGAALDVDALAKLLSDVSRFAYAQRDSLAELDLNPVFVYEKGKGVAIADALIVLEE
ncbi:MAG: acetate--CoA ligase family protein [Eubacteriales bacterium]|nr:acetate--CoA ligase family protein [Eubacteriales bacterium]